MRAQDRRLYSVRLDHLGVEHAKRIMVGRGGRAGRRERFGPEMEWPVLRAGHCREPVGWARGSASGCTMYVVGIDRPWRPTGSESQTHRYLRSSTMPCTV